MGPRRNARALLRRGRQEENLSTGASMAERAYVYILASKPRGTLYIGVSGYLPVRIEQHKAGAVPGFTAKYGVNRLV